MTTVTIPADADTSPKLSLLEQQLLLDRPHLRENREHARHLVREANPRPAELDHLGLRSEPEPTIDPAKPLNQRRHELLASGAERHEHEALARAMKEMPEAAAAYNAGQRMPANMVSRSAGARVYQNARADLELHRLTEATMAAEHVDVDTARRMVLRRDPALASAYAAGTPLPVREPTPRTAVDQLVADGLAEFARLSAELAAVEATLAKPPSGSLRKMAPGEHQVKGRTYVHKLSPDAGGGFFELQA